MFNTQVRLTYEDYVEFPDDKRYEIIDGELYEMTAPTVRHQVLLGNLFIIFKPHVRRQRLGSVYMAPIDVIFAENDIAQPDLVFVSESRRNIIQDHAIVGAPDLVIEILSPSTAAHDRNRKADLYARYGVAEYWMVHPETETVEVRRLRDGEYGDASIYESDLVSTPLIPGLDVALADIFAQD